MNVDRVLAQHYGFTDETIDELQLGWACGHLFEHFADEPEGRAQPGAQDRAVRCW